ncbi:GLE1-domain-containing protein [Acephala macrosclerotiorum]|nr:GLE1-domain-containing protein [Acephala macrosclerotiorum]
MSENSPKGDTSSPQPPHSNVNMDTANIPYELRNAEAVHRVMLDESRTYHENLRKEAERVLAKHLLEERLRDLKLQADQAEHISKLRCEAIEQEKRKQEAEARRLKAEAELQEAAQRTREAEIKKREAENAAKAMPAVPQRVSTPPPQAAPVNQPAARQPPSNPPASSSAGNPPSANQPPAQTTTPQAQPPANHFTPGQPAQPTPPQAAQNNFPPKTHPAPPQTHPTLPNGQPPPNQQGHQPHPATAMVNDPDALKYASIHQALKPFRKQVKPNLRDKAGERIRGPDGKPIMGPLEDEASKQSRLIRAAVGQLKAAGSNAATYKRLIDILKNSLTYQVNGQILPVDPSAFVAQVPPPLNDPYAKNNGDQLPALFVYLLSTFAKSLVAQAGLEAHSDVQIAEAVALAAHQVFSHPDLLWRGRSMIDILVAKIRKACGTLFGFRGSETTEEGRARLGWQKEDGNWIQESMHYDRMRGIAAFYAGLCLRQYKNRVNPYPPYHYWRAMAAVVSCPVQERTNTSYYVLNALIKGHEAKFLQFYGDMAKAALWAALVEYPAGAPEKNPAVTALSTLGENVLQA